MALPHRLRNVVTRNHSKILSAGSAMPTRFGICRVLFYGSKGFVVGGETPSSRSDFAAGLTKSIDEVPPIILRRER